MKGRKVRILLEVISVIVIVALTFTLLNRHQSTSSSVSSTTTTQIANSTTSTTAGNTNPSNLSVPFNGRIVSVLDFGADPTGKTDSRLAILAALRSAEQKPGSELYFPPGTFNVSTLTTHEGEFVVTVPIRIVGSGVNSTTILDAVGQVSGFSSPPPLFLIKGSGTSLPGKASGTVVEGFTINCAKYQTGTAIIDFADNTEIQNLVVYAPSSSKQYNPDQFGIRVIAICNRNNYQTVYRSGNVVKNVTIVGSGSAGNTELDISCQKNSSVSNVSINGNGLDVYFSQNVSLSNLNLVGGSGSQSGQFTWVVVGSHNINLANVVTSGEGGVITQAAQSTSTNITVTNEIMKDKSKEFFIGDVNGIRVVDSQLGKVVFGPLVQSSDITFVNTSYLGAKCPNSEHVQQLAGVTCK